MPAPVQSDVAPLRADELAKLIRPRYRAFLPDHVARNLANRKPTVLIADVDAMAPIMASLVATARQRMHDDGIELPTRSDLPMPVLNGRERARAETLGVLLPYHALMIFYGERKSEEALDIVDEALGWARISGSRRRETIVLIAKAILHEYRLEYGKEQNAYREALRIAEQLGDEPVLAIEVAGFLAAALVARHHLAEASELLAATIEKARRLLSPEEQPRLFTSLHLNLGKVRAFSHDMRDALALYLEANEYARLTDDVGSRGAVLTQIGLLYRGLGDNARSIEYQRELVALCEQENYDIGLTWGYARIAESSMDLDDFESAEKALRMAELHTADHHGVAYHFVLYKWADLYFRQGKIDEGIGRCARLLDLLENQPITYQTCVAHHLHGRLLVLQESFEQAEQAYRRSLECVERMEGKVDSIIATSSLARLLIDRDRADEAYALLQDEIERARPELSESFQLASAHELMGDAAEKLGDMRKALEHMRTGRDIAAKALEGRTTESVKKARIISEVELLRKEAEMERRERARAEGKLAETFLEFEGKKYILDRVERELQRTLAYLEKSQALEVVHALKSALVEIDLQDRMGGSPPDYLSTLDPDFFTRLRERWPGLTRKQERLCGLIRSGLTSSEISSILNVSYEGMRAQRKRLRKRMGLDADANLEGVIGGV